MADSQSSTSLVPNVGWLRPKRVGLGEERVDALCHRDSALPCHALTLEGTNGSEGRRGGSLALSGLGRR